MIEKISLALADESGNQIPVVKVSPTQIEIKIETAIADLFSEICRRNNSIEDTEIKLSEKFIFALNLQKHLKEMKETYAG